MEAKKKILHITQAMGGVKTYLTHVFDYADTDRFEFVLIAPRDPAFQQYCAEKSIRYHAIDLQRSIAPFADLAGLYKIAAIIKKEKPDLVHTHSAKGGFLGRLAARFNKSKVVYTPHGFSYMSFTGIKRVLFYLLEMLAQKWTTLLLGVSYSEANRAVFEIGFSPDKVKVILNAIPIGTVHQAVLTNQCFRIGMIGRLTYQKNPILFLEIAMMLKAKFPLLKFSILGAGLHDHLSKEIDAYLLKHKMLTTVEFMSWGDEGTSSEYLKDIDVFVMTSVFEGLPFSLLEAMGRGIPCVVSKVDGNTDVIQNGENGFACLTKDEFVDKLSSLVMNHQLRVSIGKAGYKYAYRHHSIEQNIKQLETTYIELIEARKEAVLLPDVMIKKRVGRVAVILPALLALSTCLTAQLQHQGYEFRHYQKIDSTVYNRKTSIHSAFKPYFADDTLLSPAFNNLVSIGFDTVNRSWLHKKIFNEHLLDVKREDYTVFADFLPDFQAGREFFNDRSTWLNTRGYQIGGTVLKKFSFYTSGFENQGSFADYYGNYVDAHSVVPGQSYNRRSDFIEIPRTKDWSYVTALVSYTPIKYLNITVGHDKNFIGDGYRSLLLSDFSSPYTFLKLTGNLGNVQYTVMWAGMQDPSAKKLSEYTGNRKKGAVFHYLDWNVNNRLSIGFFDAVVYARTDDEGNRRGFDADYINPIVFLRPLDGSAASPDNAMLGFNVKYELLKNATVYGQFVVDDFVAKHFLSGDGFFRNKSGVQVGVRGAGPFGISKLNYLVEYNGVRPLTYSEKDLSIINYAHYNEPLAHPLGANFREFLTVLGYNLNKVDLTLQANYAQYGYDLNGMNYGKNIFNLYNENTMETGNYIGQGLRTNFYYAQGKVSYLVNPKYNLRLELAGIYRHETNDLLNDKTAWVTFGLRSTFRNLYSDF